MRSRSASGEKEVDARRGELEREWQPVQPHGDLGDRRGILVREAEVRLHRSRALDEELDRLVRAELFGGSAPANCVRQRKRRDSEQVLAAQMQRFTARHEQLQPRSALQELCELRRGHGHLLEVVEDQQHVLVTEPRLQLFEEGFGGRGVQADRTCDRRQHRFAVARRGDIDEEHTVLEPVELVGRSANREPGLSDAAWSCQREKPHRLAGKAFRDLVKLRLPAHECGRLVRKSTAASCGRDERREARGKSRIDELKDALGAAQALQPVRAQIL